MVYGTVTAYLNPTSADTISETQKEETEKNIRYQMMTLMKSGLIDSELALVEHARYISPLVVMSEKERTNAESQPYQQFTGTSDSAGITVTISILIIAACFTIIGAAGLILTVKVLYRQDEEHYSTVKQPCTYDNGTMEHTACGTEERNMWEQVVNSDDDFKDTNQQNDEFTRKQNISHQVVQTKEKYQDASSDNDWGTNANMSATMRRVVVTKKVPLTRARGGEVTNLGSVMEEEDEEAQNQ